MSNQVHLQSVLGKTWLFTDEYIFKFIIAVVVFLLIKAIHKFLNAGRPKIPGPYPWPLIGNVPSLGSKPQYSMQAMSQRYGPIFLMKLGSMDVVVLNDYDSIGEALGKHSRAFSGRPPFKSFAKISQGKGIVFNSQLTQGENWYKLKKVVIKHIHDFITNKETRGVLADHIKKEAIELVKKLHQDCQNSPDGVVEPETTINVSVANIVCAMMFGHRYSYDDKTFQDLVSLNRQFGNVVGAGSQVDVMPWIQIFPVFKKAMATFNFLTDRLNNWMLKRTKEHKSTYVHGVTRDLVDTLIARSIDKPNGLLKEDIIMSLITDIFGAGQDTLSTAFQWILIYAMYFPEMQKKIHQEIDAVLGDESLPDVSDRKRFPYMEAFFHEVCRHSTFTAMTLPHLTTRDIALAGYHIPKGTLVFINQFAANHDPKYWNKPDEFRPERFLNERGELIDNPHKSYLLFSQGSRKCPGDEISRLLLLHFMTNIFALCEMKPDPLKPTFPDGMCNLSTRPKFLRIQLQIRKQQYFRELQASLNSFNPHVPTVIPDQLSTNLKSSYSGLILSKLFPLFLTLFTVTTILFKVF